MLYTLTKECWMTSPHLIKKMSKKICFLSKVWFVQESKRAQLSKNVDNCLEIWHDKHKVKSKIQKSERNWKKDPQSKGLFSIKEKSIAPNSPTFVIVIFIY